MESGNGTTVVCLEGLLTLSNVYEKVKMYMRNRGKVKHELRVTSSNPRVTSSNPQVTSLNPRVTSSDPRVTSSNPRVTS